MSVRSILAFVITVAALAAPTSAWAIGDCIQSPDWPAPRADAAQLVTLVNQHRAARGLAALTVSPSLTNAAVWKSRHMAAFSYMAHDDLNYPLPGQIRLFSDRILTCGYAWPAGENIGFGYLTPQSIMQGWLDSPAHRANIEYPGYTVIGVGGAGTYWTQDFGVVASTTVAVTLRSLSADRVQGGVQVTWRTASELDTLGFNVYREVNGKRVRANAKLIAGKGRGHYSFLDRKAPKGKTVRYWIQTVRLDGSRSWYGPARLLPQAVR